MNSPWQIPLPLPEYLTSQVVVYAYEGEWAPVFFCSLGDALKFYGKLQLLSTQVFVFPVDLTPKSFDTALSDPSYEVASIVPTPPVTAKTSPNTLRKNSKASFLTQITSQAKALEVFQSVRSKTTKSLQDMKRQIG